MARYPYTGFEQLGLFGSSEDGGNRMEPPRAALYLIDPGHFQRVKLGSFYPTVTMSSSTKDAVISVINLAKFLRSYDHSPLRLSEHLNLYAMLNGYSCEAELGEVKHFWKGGPKDPQADMDLGSVYEYQDVWRWSPNAPREHYKMPDAASSVALGLRPPPDPKPRPTIPPTPTPPSLPMPIPTFTGLMVGRRSGDAIQIPMELVSALLMMFGGEIKLTEDDLVAAERIRGARRVRITMCQDPRSYTLKFEE